MRDYFLNSLIAISLPGTNSTMPSPFLKWMVAFWPSVMRMPLAAGTAFSRKRRSALSLITAVSKLSRVWNWTVKSMGPTKCSTWLRGAAAMLDVSAGGGGLGAALQPARAKAIRESVSPWCIVKLLAVARSAEGSKRLCLSIYTKPSKVLCKGNVRAAAPGTAHLLVPVGGAQCQGVGQAHGAEGCGLLRSASFLRTAWLSFHDRPPVVPCFCCRH